jgi:hypothetical protein
MKENKLLGALNYVFSAISSIIVIIFVHLPLVIFTSDIQIYALDDKYNVYNLLSLSNTNAQFMDSSNLGVLAGVFAIIAFALAVVILIASIFMILKKFGVYDWKLDGKFSDFDLIFNALASILAVVAFGVFLVANFLKNAQIQNLDHFTLSVTPFAIVLFAVPVALCLAMWVNSSIKESKEKKFAAKDEPKA